MRMLGQQNHVYNNNQAAYANNANQSSNNGGMQNNSGQLGYASHSNGLGSIGSPAASLTGKSSHTTKALIAHCHVKAS